MKIYIELDSLSLTQQRDIYLVLKEKFENPSEVKPKGKNRVSKTILRRKLVEFPRDLKPSAIKILSAAGIDTIGDLCRCKPSDIYNMRGLSQGTVVTAEIFLDYWGLTLKRER
jgi:hypothetical protein